MERMAGVHRDTIMRTLTRIGAGCEIIMDQTMRNLSCRNIQIDEIWGFVGKKQRHLTSKDNPFRNGDMWTYVALDSDTKIIPTYRVGKRNSENTRAFISDLSSRLANRVQLSSDALALYLHFAHYNFCRRHQSIRVTPAMEAGIVNDMWTIQDLLRVAERAI